MIGRRAKMASNASQFPLFLFSNVLKLPITLAIVAQEVRFVLITTGVTN